MFIVSEYCGESKPRYYHVMGVDVVLLPQWKEEKKKLCKTLYIKRRILMWVHNKKAHNENSLKNEKKIDRKEIEIGKKIESIIR